MFLKFPVKSLSSPTTPKRKAKQTQKQQEQQRQKLQSPVATSTIPSRQQAPATTELFMYQPVVSTLCINNVSPKPGPDSLYQGIYSNKSEFLASFNHTTIPTLPPTSTLSPSQVNLAAEPAVASSNPIGNRSELSPSSPIAESDSSKGNHSDSDPDSYREYILLQRRNSRQRQQQENLKASDFPVPLSSSPQVQQLQQYTHDGDTTIMTATTISYNSSYGSTNVQVKNCKMSGTMFKSPVVVIGEAKSEDDSPQYTSVPGTSRSISSRRFNQNTKKIPDAILVHKKTFSSGASSTEVQTPIWEHYRPSPSSESFVFSSSSKNLDSIALRQKTSSILLHDQVGRNSVISLVSTIISSSDESLSKSPEMSDSPLSTGFLFNKGCYHSFSDLGAQFSKAVEPTPDATVAIETEVNMTDMTKHNDISHVVAEKYDGLVSEDLQQQDQVPQQQRLNQQQPQPELHFEPSSVISKLKDKNPFLPIIMNLYDTELENSEFCDHNNYPHHYDDELELFEYYLTIQ